MNIKKAIQKIEGIRSKSCNFHRLSKKSLHLNSIFLNIVESSQSFIASPIKEKYINDINELCTLIIKTQKEFDSKDYSDIADFLFF